MYYVTTTDYVQHKNAPGTTVADNFYGRIDDVLGGLHRFGAAFGITADHGMNDKVCVDLCMCVCVCLC